MSLCRPPTQVTYSSRVGSKEPRSGSFVGASLDKGCTMCGGASGSSGQEPRIATAYDGRGNSLHLALTPSL